MKHSVDPEGPAILQAARIGSTTAIGIALFILGVSLASLQSGLAKYLTATLPVLLIVWGRYIGFLVIVLVVTLWRCGVSALPPPRPHAQALRGILLVSATIFFLGAVKGMPLADAIAIIFIYPFIVTALAPVVLGERVPLSSWMAVVTGFVGVLLVVRPGPTGVNWHTMLALAAGTCFGVHLLVTRRLTAAAPPLVTATSTALIGAVALSATLPFVWQPLSWQQAGILTLIGATAAASQLLIIVACTKAQLSTLAPFGYTEIIAATAVGFLMFGDFPDWLTWVGIAVIVLSGVYIAFTARGARLPLISRTRPPAS